MGLVLDMNSVDDDPSIFAETILGLTLRARGRW
jgi:hypothetical protein